MPEVWTHNNLSRHFMPRFDIVFQLFILLCNIVSFMFLFNWRCKIIDFIEDQQISLVKSRYEANCGGHSAKVQVQRHHPWVLMSVYNATFIIKVIFFHTITLGRCNLTLSIVSIINQNNGKRNGYTIYNVSSHILFGLQKNEQPNMRVN